MTESTTQARMSKAIKDAVHELTVAVWAAVNVLDFHAKGLTADERDALAADLQHAGKRCDELRSDAVRGARRVQRRRMAA